MSEVRCSRCGLEAAGLERPPLPGTLGAAIHAQVCAACWREWLATQVKYINEYRLNPLEPKHFEFLMEQARTFLHLSEAPASDEPST